MSTTKTTQKALPFLPVFVYEKNHTHLRRRLILARFYKTGIEVQRKKGTVFYPIPAHPRHYLRGNVLNMYIDGTMLFPIEDPEIYADPRYSKRFQTSKEAELTRLNREAEHFSNFLEEIRKAATEEEFDLALKRYLATGHKFTPVLEEIENRIYHIRAGNPTWIIRVVKVDSKNSKITVKVAIDTGATIGLITPKMADQLNVKRTGKYALVKGYGNGTRRLETVFLDIEYEGVTVQCLLAVDPETARIATVPIMVPVSVYFDFKAQHVQFP